MFEEKLITIDLQASMDRTIITILLNSDEPISDADVYQALKQYIDEYELGFKEETLQ